MEHLPEGQLIEDQANQRKPTDETPTVETPTIETPSEVQPPKDETATESEEPEEGTMTSEEDGFVKLDADDSYVEESDRADFLNQLEKILTYQSEMCKHYAEAFDKHGNITMAQKFHLYHHTTDNDLELLQKVFRAPGAEIPRYKFDPIYFNCLPTNVDVRPQELQIQIKSCAFPGTDNTSIYVIGEFEFPIQKEESLGESFARWWKNVKIEPKKVLFCRNPAARQLDMIYGTNVKPFNNPDDNLIIFDRPLSFFVDKGKSRTLKRKFKPIKLTVYEKNSLAKADKKLGHVQFKIDDINEESTIITRRNLVCGRKETTYFVDIKIKVREPLVNKAIKAHEEKMLLLTV